jgi:hypothetical protein
MQITVMATDGHVAAVGTFVKTLMDRKIGGVMLDMDKTMVSEHSRGCLPKNDVPWFAKSITPAARDLIIELLKNGLQVSIGTYSDELYAKDDIKNSIAGAPLVYEVLRPFLDEKQLSQIYIIGLNPDLYTPAPKTSTTTPPTADKSETPKSTGLFDWCCCCRSKKPAQERIDPNQSFFQDKMTAIFHKGMNVDKKNTKICYTYPPMPFKNHHLHVFKALTGLDFGRMVLIDDSMENVTGARKLGSWAVHVDGNTGLQAEHFKEIK